MWFNETKNYAPSISKEKKKKLIPWYRGSSLQFPLKLQHLIVKLSTQLWHCSWIQIFLISSFIWYHHVISIELPREQAKRQEMKSMLCLCTGCYFISMGTTDVAVNLIYERVTTRKATDEGVHSRRRRHPQFSPQPYLCLTRKESGFLMKNTLSCSCNQRSIYKHGINFHDENKANKNHFIRAKKTGVLLIRSVNYDDQKVLLVADIFTIHFIVFTVSLKHLIMFGIHTFLFFVHGKVCYPNYFPSFCMLLVQFSRNPYILLQKQSL